MISIIIPVSFENEIYFSETINSLKKQSFKKFELIIILDGTVRIDKSNLNDFYKLKILSIKKTGVAKARNVGIAHSSFNIICFLDSDDIWHKDKLKIQFNHFKKKKIDFSYTKYKLLNKNYERNVYQIKKIQDLILNNPICTSSVMINKKLFFERKFSKIKMRSDFEFWLYLFKKKISLNYINNYNQNLVYYRRHNNSLSSNKYVATFYHFKVLLDKFNLFFALYLSIKYIVFNLLPLKISKKFVIINKKR